MKIICVAFLLMVVVGRSSASDLTAIAVEEIGRDPAAYQGRHVAVFGRISMKFESTYIKTCDRRKGSSEKFVDLLLHDDAYPATETQANQYFTNLHRYALLDGRCGWVVGVFDTDDSKASVPSSIGVIKMITYIGGERPHGLN